MNTAIIHHREVILQPATTSKNARSQLNQYNEWCQQTGRSILAPDLAAYRDYLLQRLTPTSAKAHLSHIRAAYRQLTHNRDLFYSQVPREHADSAANQKAWVDEAILRLQQATHPNQAKVEVIKEQDVEDDKHLRLTKDEASQYINSFGTKTIRQLRNTAIITLMLCTGLREFELCNLEVDDLRQTLGGELALRVKRGKGCKKRLVPYGQLSWVLVLVDAYLERADITEGRLFPLCVRQIENIVTSKPVSVGGVLRTVRPHDLRRTYAKLLYLEGMNLVAIRDNLGHASVKTTERYIGVLNADDRKPANLYRFDLSKI